MADSEKKAPRPAARLPASPGPVDEPATVLMPRAQRPQPHPPEPQTVVESRPPVAPPSLPPPAQQTADTDMLAGKATRMQDLSASVLSAGDRIGPYVVERVIGSGGMGLVVAARHEGSNDRVAIKVLRPKAASDEVHAERFAREARAIAKIRSEHVVRVLDAGGERGAPYIVMEYLVGRDLARVLREEGPLPVPRAATLMLQVCEAVASAHAVGVIHRDLKPSNFFVTGANDLVKVLDFGIAKAIGQEGIADPNLTETQAVFGSPTYMSPEQIRSAKHVDPRSDIWSLGVAFYELVTGKLPFAADNVAGLLASIIADPPFFPRGFVPDLPAELEAILLACLAKDARERIQSVPELAFRLAPFAPPSTAVRALLARIDALARTMNVSTAPRQAPPDRSSQPDARRMVLPTAPALSTHGTLGSTTFGSTGVDLAAVAPGRPGRVAAAALGGGLVAILVLVGVLGAYQLRRPAPAPALAAPSAMAAEPSAIAAEPAPARTVAAPEPSATPTTSAPPATPSAGKPRGGHPRPHPGVRSPGAPKSADPTSDRY